MTIINNEITIALQVAWDNNTINPYALPAEVPHMSPIFTAFVMIIITNQIRLLMTYTVTRPECKLAISSD